MSFQGTREAFAQAMMDLAKNDQRVMLVSADSLKAMRATAFAKAYPDQYVEVGISEQASVTVATGLSTCGLKPYVATYAGFLTMRACEQIRTFVAYPQTNVTFVGINGGLIGGEREGVTHQFYEDVGILSTIPGIQIFTPADGAQLYQAMMVADQINGPVYIRAGSGKEADVFAKDAPFSMDGFTVLKEAGKEALLLSSGFVLPRVLQAADKLIAKGYAVTVADVNWIGLKQCDAFCALLAKADHIVTVEDHNVNGGLGSWVASLLCEHSPKPLKRLGLHSFGQSGTADVLADAYGFSVDNIQKTVQAMLS